MVHWTITFSDNSKITNFNSGEIDDAKKKNKDEEKEKMRKAAELRMKSYPVVCFMDSIKGF
ncbi:CFC_HP_G0057160.mRNA.1.CDS.1 [Saccharomyces cerevisiae]|nr:CFC_HP_G0057160.mRNA.1.CDS.1 [Saccharomyces cerevisiae]CAI6540077.1 CFC_HP_G0057160.mRNA.1.CDS.1 [Saccharomyces cerevisiae]